MIVPMDQLTVVGRRGSTHEVLQSLQNLGVVQIDPFQPDEDLGLARIELTGSDKHDEERWAAIVARSESLLQVLHANGESKAGRSDVLTAVPEIESYLQSVGSSVDALIAERAEAQDELDLIALYLPVFRTLAPTLARLDKSHYLAGTPVLVPSEDLAGLRSGVLEALDGRAEFSIHDRGRDALVLIGTLKGDQAALRQALGRLGSAPLELPLRYHGHGTAKAVHVMEERSQALPRRLAAIEEELERLSAAHAAKLKQVRNNALNQHARFERMEDLLAGRYSFALRGWVPSDTTRKVEEALRKQFNGDVIVVSRAADEHTDKSVPVRLHNAKWSRPFELLLSLFDPPGYGTFDPTWTMAIFFPLFFGIVVGDFGYGLLFLALGMWLRSRGLKGNDLSLGPLGITIDAAALPGIGVIVNWCAGWSILWGIIYGEFFGNFLEFWPAGNPVFFVPGHGEGMFPVALFRVEQFQPLLMITIGFGVLQVLGGWVVRAWYGYKHGDTKHLWEGIGMFAGLAGLVVFAYAFLTDAVSTPIMVFLIAGMAIFLVGAVIARMPLMLIEVISNSGNILSYLRLFAVGLSAALVANLSTSLGMAIAGAINIPVLGALLGIVTAMSVHLLAIALTLIGHALQPLRLQYVEFFTKFGFYENNGRPFRPFRLSGGKA
jgi:V/A-type H+-transporting ATPase subunit I